jgi:hypothetical protein
MDQCESMLLHAYCLSSKTCKKVIKLYGRFGPHAPGIARHYRTCNIKYEYLDLPNAQCGFVLAEDMAQIARSPNKEL